MTQRMRSLGGRARSVVATGSAGMTTAEYAVGTLAAVERAQAGDAGAARSAAAVVEPAREAFVAAMHLTALGTVAAALVATAVVLVWMPGRDRRPPAGGARAPAGQAAEPARG